MKVIHVHLIVKRADYYFGSVAAIYDHLTEYDIGIKRSYLSHSLSSDMVVTDRAIIKRREILRSNRQT